MKGCMFILALLLLAACGNGTAAPTYEHTYGIAYEACIEEATGEEGFTEGYAKKFCQCFMDGLAEVYSTERIQEFYAEDGVEPGLDDVAIMAEIGMKCLVEP